MKRTVDYRWRLAELMAARGMHNTTELIPHLAERDITLSRPQVYRLVTQHYLESNACEHHSVLIRSSSPR